MGRVHTRVGAKRFGLYSREEQRKRFSFYAHSDIVRVCYFFSPCRLFFAFWSVYNETRSKTTHTNTTYMHRKHKLLHGNGIYYRITTSLYIYIHTQSLFAHPSLSSSISPLPCPLAHSNLSVSLSLPNRVRVYSAAQRHQNRRIQYGGSSI